MEGPVIPWYDFGMAVKKLSISMDAALASEIAALAEERGESISGWMAEAAAARVRNQRLREILDEWDSTFGPVPQSELDEVDRLWPD